MWTSRRCLLLLLLLSRFSRVQLCATPEMAAHQAKLQTVINLQFLDTISILCIQTPGQPSLPKPAL